MGQGISLRVAILAAMVLILTQMLITQWTIRAGTSQEIINYVSFAGTLVSILLAVLAIVYSYYTTSSQKTDADRIATQIGTLTATASTLATSEESLASELKRLTEVRQKMDEVVIHLQASDIRSREIQNSIEELRKEKAEEGSKEIAAAEESAAAQSDGGSEICFKFGAALIAKGASDRQVPYLWVAYDTIVKNIDGEASSKELADLFLQEKKGSVREIAAFSEAHTFSMILLDFKLDRSEESRKSFEAAAIARTKVFLQNIDNVVTNYDSGKLADWLEGKMAPLLAQQSVL